MSNGFFESEFKSNAIFNFLNSVFGNIVKINIGLAGAALYKTKSTLALKTDKILNDCNL